VVLRDDARQRSYIQGGASSLSANPEVGRVPIRDLALPAVVRSESNLAVDLLGRDFRFTGTSRVWVGLLLSRGLARALASRTPSHSLLVRSMSLPVWLRRCASPSECGILHATSPDACEGGRRTCLASCSVWSMGGLSRCVCTPSEDGRFHRFASGGSWKTGVRRRRSRDLGRGAVLISLGRGYRGFAVHDGADVVRRVACQGCAVAGFAAIWIAAVRTRGLGKSSQYW
jgi:hypothetical protein